MKHKRTFWLLAIPLLAAGVFIFTQSATVYAKGPTGSRNHNDQNVNHGQMMKDYWKDPSFRTQMQNMMRDHHGANWQNHHQQMHGLDSEP